MTQMNGGGLKEIAAGLYLYRDTCNVFVLVRDGRAVLIDFGSGDVLDALAEAGVGKVVGVLMTHHHRDQGQGLGRAVQAGISVYVPHTEQDLFHSVDAHWQGRPVLNNYNVRQDRFSLLESVAVAGTLRDYATWAEAGFSLTILPTPGHTTGSISLMTIWNGQRLIFSGDLIYETGKVWSLSATQWTYNGAEGIPATIASLLDLVDRQPAMLLPSHGELIIDVERAAEPLIKRLWKLLQMRKQNPRLFQLRDRPYEVITPHLLMHRVSMANTYVVLSASGKALFIDFGYDFLTGIPAGSDRASRRPWLYTIPTLKRLFDVDRIDVVLPTHYHDDHVAGINLLRDVEGAQCWAAESFAEIIQNPAAFDLPCLWYDPITVDKQLPLTEPIHWEEYSFTLFPLPGHTHYAVAVAFEVDGKRVLATGDQYQGDDGLSWNYVYQNRYQLGDYVETARLYRRLQPDLILSGHWQPLWVPEGYLEKIVTEAEEMESLQRDLLPAEPDLGAEGFLARIHPYTVTLPAGESVEFGVELHNPFSTPQRVVLKIVTPSGWKAVPEPVPFTIQKEERVSFQVKTPIDVRLFRARIAVDVTIGGQRFGQQAEALISTTG